MKVYTDAFSQCSFVTVIAKQKTTHNWAITRSKNNNNVGWNYFVYMCFMIVYYEGAKDCSTFLQVSENILRY